MGGRRLAALEPISPFLTSQRGHDWTRIDTGALFPREAFVCAFDRANGEVWEARVDLIADKVVDWRHVPGVRPRILLDDITLVGEVARADPRFREALAKRGITDIENVQVDPWSAGNYGLPDEQGRRLSHTFCWYRSEKNDNG